MTFAVVNGTEVAVPPPDYYPIDFANPTRDETTITQAYCLFALEFAMATILLGQRVYTNAVMLRRVFLDDFLLIAAWLFSLGAQTGILYGFSSGLIGVHAWEMPVDMYSKYSLNVLYTTLMYIPATILAKLTLCVLYYRMSPAQLWRWAILSTAFLCASSLVAIWFSIIFACQPISAAWDQRLVETAQCIDKPRVYIAQAAFGCVTDLVLLILPIPTVFSLRTTTRQKIGLLVMFGIGSITMVTSIVRLVILIPSLTDLDQSWSLAKGSLWVIIEANLLIVCGSLPTLRLFVQKVKSPRPSTREKTVSLSSQPRKGNDNKGHRSSLRTFGRGNETKNHKFSTIIELEDKHRHNNDSNKNNSNNSKDCSNKFDESNLRPDDVYRPDINIYSTSPGSESIEDLVTAAETTGDEAAILHTRTTTVTWSSR